MAWTPPRSPGPVRPRLTFRRVLVITLATLFGICAFGNSMNTLSRLRKAKKPPPAPAAATAPKSANFWPKPPAPVAPIGLKVALHVAARRLDPSVPPWPMEDEVRRLLTRAGLEVAPAGPDTAGVVLVDCEETEGRLYTVYTGSHPSLQQPVASFTAMNLRVRVALSRGDHVLGTVTLELEPPVEIPHTTSQVGLRAIVYDRLAADPAWQHLGTLVAAGLGHEPARARALAICSHPLAGRGAAALLRAGGFAPAEPAEHAALHVGDGEFAKAGALGPPAVPALVRALDRCVDGDALLAIAAALAGTDDPRASAALASALSWEPPGSGDTQSVERRQARMDRLRVLLPLLARAGRHDALHAIDAARTGADPDILKLADEASDAIIRHRWKP